MAYKLHEGFEKATSSNLPRLDAFMMASFFNTCEKFLQPEVKNTKTSRNMRPEYGDSAIGYVQLKRDGSVVHMRAAVSPETWVRKSSYNLTLSVDEEKIFEVSCLDCKASRGGCKHSVAMLAWLHRRSEEPSPTEVTCYWRKSTLSRVGTTLRAVTARSMAGLPDDDDEDREHVTFLNEIIDCLNEIPCCNSNLLNEVNPSLHCLSMHALLLNFVKNGSIIFHEFLNFVSQELSNFDLVDISKDTILQSECLLWKELKYARITASNLHCVAQCKTEYGATTKLLLGASKVKDNKFMKRGRDLEPKILKEVEKKLGQKIQKVGLVLHEKHPLFGASPDGITDHYVIEIKAPFHDKTFSNYISNENQPTLRYKLQILLQMYFCDKEYGFFCVADPKFELNKKVTVVKIHRNDEFLAPYMEKAAKFWEKNVFSRLLNGAQYASSRC